MIKLKKINKEIGKKLTAFTLATTTSFTAISGVSAKTGDMCYEEQTIAEYKTVAGDYVIKKTRNNFLEITESNSRNTNRLTLSNDGEVKITTQNKKYLGLFTDTDTTTFKINNFNSQKLDIGDIKTDNKELKKVIKSLENYINGNMLTNTNYVELLGEDLMDGMCYNNGLEIKDVSKKQYDDAEANYYGELNRAGLVMASTLVPLASNGMVISGALETGGAAAVAVNPTVVLSFLLIIGLYATDTYIDNRIPLTLDAIEDYTYDIGGVDVRSVDIADCVPISMAMDQIETNYRDNNPDNDYFQAKIGPNNDVYINLAKPLSIEQAANLLKIPGWQSTLINNIYTYQPEDALKVIKNAGGVAGTSGRRENFAECHAFDKSYKSFDCVSNFYDFNTLSLKRMPVPGVYYWHYHFFDSRVDFTSSERKHRKHVFFGIPIIVTQNDIDKYNSNGSLSAGQMDNYEAIRNNFARSRSLKK